MLYKIVVGFLIAINFYLRFWIDFVFVAGHMKGIVYVNSKIVW